MLIAIDYDGTITADQELFKAFYYMAKAAGHEVICVTMRSEQEPIAHFPARVYYTDRKAKKPWCERNGLKVDIWIDDNPGWVVHDSY